MNKFIRYFSQKNAMHMDMRNKKFFMISLEVIILSSLLFTSLSPIKISTHPDNMVYTCSHPEIAIDDFQNAYVVWEGSDGNDKEIYWVKIDTSGHPGTVQKISTHPDNYEHDDWNPHIRVDGAGNSYVVWMGHDGNDLEIYWVTIDALGYAGTVQKISTHPDNPEAHDSSPQIAIDSDCNSHVVWHRFDENTYDIYWIKINPSGNQGAIKKISTHPDNLYYSEFNALVEVGPSGDIFVVYYGYDSPIHEEEPEDQKMYWIHLDPDGTVKIVKKISNLQGIIREDRYKFTFTIDTFENSYIAWGAYAENHSDIYLEKIDRAGNSTPVQKISNHINKITDNDRFPFMDTDEEGNCYIVWQCYIGKDTEIYWNRLDSSGLPDTPVKASSYFLSESFSDFGPQIAVDSLGNSYIVWMSDNDVWGEGHRRKILWIQIDKDGQAGKVRDISDRKNTVCKDSSPQIAVDSSGISYVVWSGPDETDSNHLFFTVHVESSSSIEIIIGGIVICALISALIICMKKRKKNL